MKNILNEKNFLSAKKIRNIANPESGVCDFDYNKKIIDNKLIALINGEYTFIMNVADFPKWEIIQ